MQKIEFARQWLKDSVIPLWIEKGIDPRNGAFVESLSREGQPQATARRAMVQARQIYSFTEAERLCLLPHDQAQAIVARAADFLLAHYGLPSGAFVHAADVDGRPTQPQVDLYTQAFVLFGLAHAFAITRETKYKIRALELLAYLNRERKLESGGFSEKIGAQITYAANPHMHLFEAAIAWAKVDANPNWRDLAQGIFNLCQTRFIDLATGALAELFDGQWQPLRENGRFFFEPGHHYEWAWLLMQYEEFCQPSGTAFTSGAKLFSVSERHGRVAGFAVDEVWSDFSIKKPSARFWPQSERVKAAVALGVKAPEREHSVYAAAADEAMTALFKYFAVPTPGLWEDTLSPTGAFVEQPAKASSLYHIINAIAEYIAKRPKLILI